jgi:hypothetical protein
MQDFLQRPRYTACTRFWLRSIIHLPIISGIAVLNFNFHAICGRYVVCFFVYRFFTSKTALAHLASGFLITNIFSPALCSLVMKIDVYDHTFKKNEK